MYRSKSLNAFSIALGRYKDTVVMIIPPGIDKDFCGFNPGVAARDFSYHINIIANTVPGLPNFINFLMVCFYIRNSL
jgi:hypothetical protein